MFFSLTFSVSFASFLLAKVIPMREKRGIGGVEAFGEKAKREIRFVLVLLLSFVFSFY